MMSSNVLTLPDVMLTSHSIPQACWNVIIEHPFGVLLNKSYCMFPDPFLPRVAVTVGKGSGYARLGKVWVGGWVRVWLFDIKYQFIVLNAAIQ